MPKRAPVASQLDVEIGSRIRFARRERGLSQSKLGSAVDITFQQMQKYEKGHNRISVTRLLRIAQQLKLPLTYFTDGLLPKQTPAPSHTITPGELLRANDALQLVTAFNTITSRSLRKRCLQMVQSLAADQGPD